MRVAVTAEPKPLRAASKERVANRERVLRAARAEFDRRGIDAQMDSIALRAGVGVATIYRLFATKEALFEAVVFEDLQMLAASGRPLVDAQDPGLVLYGFLGDLVEQCQSSAAVRDALGGAAELGLTAERARRDLENVIAALLMRAQLRGDARNDVGATEVLALIAAIVHSQARANPGSGVDPSRLVSLLCDGLRTTRRPVAGPA